MSELTHCSICGCALEDEAECYEVENEILCQDCYDNETVICDHCGGRLTYSSITITIGGVQLVE